MNHLTDPQKKERPKSLSFCSDNTVTDDQQAAPVHSGPPFFGFRAYSRCDRLPHAVRSQGSENCCRYPNWVNRVVLPLCRLLPVLPEQRTCRCTALSDAMCQNRNWPVSSADFSF